MIMTVVELRQFVTTDKTDQVLEAMLQALETAIKGYTNNSFKRVLEANNGEYPADIKFGVANMLKWQLDNGDKVGVQSETISRHSVTYFDLSGDNSTMGVPKSLTGFLMPYKRARFGQGLSI